jgi:hypothetical protein
MTWRVFLESEPLKQSDIILEWWGLNTVEGLSNHLIKLYTQNLNANSFQNRSGLVKPSSLDIDCKKDELL